MPQTRTKHRIESQKGAAPAELAFRRPTVESAHELLDRMIRYEAAANGASESFTKMTATERQLLRADLVSEYIRLSAGNLSATPSYYDAAMISFCSRICQAAVPSHELLGTFLAAMDIVSRDRRLCAVQGLAESVRKTFFSVLETCSDLLKKKADLTAVATGT